VYDTSHLNPLIDEAERNTLHFYPTQANCFRTHGANPGAIDGEQSVKDTIKHDKKATKWNSKFTATNVRPCAAFNGKRDHRADELLPDGTCRRNHVCDQFVSSKGPGGKCLGEKGVAGHSRDACTHPDKSARVD